MADEPQAQNVPENDTQDAPMPSADQQTAQSGETTKDELNQAEAKVAEAEESNLPKDVKDRTRKEFEKLQRKYREERAKRLEVESAFSAMRPKTQPATSKKPDWMIDPDSGTVDVNKLSQAWTNLEQRAARAEQSVNRYIEDSQRREAVKAHPELDSRSDKFDEDLHKRTRAFLFDSMMHPDEYSNKTLTYKEAADLAKESTGKAVEQAKAEGAKQAKEQLTPKEQASLEATGRSDRRGSTEKLEDLRVKSRYTSRDGDQAIAERLKRSKL